MGGRLTVVVGGQYGSEAKGAVTAFLANEGTDEDRRNVHVVRVGGPNAGHTAYAYDGDFEGGTDRDHAPVEWKLRQVPVGFVNPDAQLYIGAGSEIDLPVLNQEIGQLDAAGHKVNDRLHIDRSATILTGTHKNTEADQDLVKRIGSTGKGIGAARADRVMRTAEIYGDNHARSSNTAFQLQAALRLGGHVIVEGTQGYGLGLHTDNYPQTTSGDCRAIDFLAQAGLSPWANYVDEFEVYVVFRTRPIRVAGNSGSLRNETTWDALGLPVERTTVTQKVRRVGEWDRDLAISALVANGHPSGHVKVALTMLDQVQPRLAGLDHMPGGSWWCGETEWDAMGDLVEHDAYYDLHELSEDYQLDLLGLMPAIVGTGPTTMFRTGWSL